MDKKHLNSLDDLLLVKLKEEETIKTKSLFQINRQESTCVQYICISLTRITYTCQTSGSKVLKPGPG